MIYKVLSVNEIPEQFKALPPGTELALIGKDLAHLLAGEAHHALLLAGAPGYGQLELALHLCKAWLCETAEADRPAMAGAPTAHMACGHCQSCRWIGEADPRQSGYTPQHPDLLWLRPEADDPLWEPSSTQAKTVKPSKEIKIKQVRDSAGFVTIGAQRGRSKVVLLSPAEALNTESANSLLKMLEEPAGQCRFVLVTEHLDRLLPTIRSRCRMFAMSAHAESAALAWLAELDINEALGRELLALTGGAPYGVVQLVRRGQSTTHRVFIESAASMPEASLSQVAAQMANLEAPVLSRLFQSWISDLIRVKLGQPVRFFPVHLSLAKQRAQQTSLHALSRLESDWRSLPKLAEHPLNPRLFIEGLLLRYCEIFR